VPGLAELLKALGFTTPFIYAAATYGFFQPHSLWAVYVPRRINGKVVVPE
jgi:hypothetical protein